MNVEHRTFEMGTCEVRAVGADQSRPAFTGHAAVFNSLSLPIPGKSGFFRERIAPGAFARALEEKQDVRFLINHDKNLLLGRTTAGTVKLGEDSRGLRVDAEIPDTSYGRDLVTLMQRGDLNQMSFGFRVGRDSWKVEDGEQVRTIHDADLTDVSVVTFPAYPAATASVDTEERMIVAALAEVRAGKILSTNNRAAIEDVIRKLQEFLASTEPQVRNVNADALVSLHERLIGSK